MCWMHLNVDTNAFDLGVSVLMGIVDEYTVGVGRCECGRRTGLCGRRCVVRIVVRPVQAVIRLMWTVVCVVGDTCVWPWA